MSSHRPLLLGLLVSFLAACAGETREPELEQPDAKEVAADFAQLYCAAFDGCECKLDAADRSDCVEALTTTITKSIASVRPASLRYDAACREPIAEFLEELACSADGDFDVELERLAFETRKCKLLAGEGDDLELCRPIGPLGRVASMGDACAPGFTCDADTGCRKLSEVGEPCELRYDQCPPGNACLDPEADGLSVCKAPASQGERCNPREEYGCAEGLVCDRESHECSEGSDPCATVACSPGLVCRAGTCEQAASGSAVGCTDDSHCSAGYMCGPEGWCVDRRQPVLCAWASWLDYCLYSEDGVCDEPGGTGLCLPGTDAHDCQ